MAGPKLQKGLWQWQCIRDKNRCSGERPGLLSETQEFYLKILCLALRCSWGKIPHIF